MVAIRQTKLWAKDISRTELAKRSWIFLIELLACKYTKTTQRKQDYSMLWKS